jgi:hypothetical protein
MTEDIIFRRRNRLKEHFTNTSNVLLYCYEKLSDAAKTTYQVIDGYDWEDKDTGDSKGYVFPALEEVAEIRHTTVRTIQRHVQELIRVKLLSRIRQRNKPSILYIEDVSDAEINKYFHFLEERKKKRGLLRVATASQSRNDKNVVSHTAPETTKMSFAYMKENEKKENENNVYEDKHPTAKKQGAGMMSLSTITAEFDIDAYRYRKKPEKKRVPDARDKHEYYARTMAEELNDTKSLGAFRVIAQLVPETVIFEALASVKETAREGKIKRSRGALFITIIQQWCAAHGKNLGFQPGTPL